MSRVNIGEAYNRLKYRPSACNTPVADQLKDELIRLRKSTRKALQQSWDEVEILQKQCAINTEVISQHDHVMEQMRKKEKTWQGRCLAAEAKLLETSEARDSMRDSFPQSKLPEENPQRSQRRLTFPQGPNNEEKLQEMSEQTVPSRNRRLSLHETVRSWVGRNDNHNEIPIELVLKIHSRDEAISSLEQTLDENIKSMQGLQAEMQSLIVTQRMKEKKIHDSHLQKEEEFKGQVESLRKELSQAVSRNNVY